MNDRFRVGLPALSGLDPERLPGSGDEMNTEPIDLSGPPEEGLIAVVRPAGHATPEEIAANDRSRLAELRWPDVLPFLPDLAEVGPVEVLVAMRERFVNAPTETNADLLQAAVNQITAAPDLHREHAHEISAAKELFHSGAGLVDQAATDNIWYEAYVHPNFRGPEFFTSMTPNWGYWRQPDLREVRDPYTHTRADDVISSVRLGASADEVGGQVIFFEHVNYGGRYLNHTIPRGERRNIAWIDRDFSGLASSALIVRQFAGDLEPVQVSRVFAVPSMAELGMTMAGIAADGPPGFTWDMWPAHDPGKIFIKVSIPLRLSTSIKIGNLPSIHIDRRLEARYWIHPFVSDGRLRASVDWCGWFVEGGLGSSHIADQFRSRVQSSVTTVQQRVDAATTRAATVTPRLSYCYLLPGRNDHRGRVTDDVTLICVR